MPRFPVKPPESSRSRKKSYLALILDQEETIIFERLSRRLQVSVGNAWSRSMCSELSTQHQRNNFIPALHTGQSEEKCQSRTLYRFFLYGFLPNLLRSLKRRLRTHDSVLRYITVASLDKCLCKEKNTRTISGIALHSGQRTDICFCAQFCQIAIPFFCGFA